MKVTVQADSVLGLRQRFRRKKNKPKSEPQSWWSKKRLRRATDVVLDVAALLAGAVICLWLFLVLWQWSAIVASILAAVLVVRLVRQARAQERQENLPY